MPSINPKLPLPLPAQGVRADLDDFHVPGDALRSTSYNWIFRDGRMVPRPGVTTLGAIVSTEKPRGIINYVDSSGNTHIVYASESKWWSYDIVTGTWLDISDPALLWAFGASAPSVVFRVFNSGGTSYLLGSNGTDTPRAWDSNPTHTFTEFGGSAPPARAMAITGDRVMLGNILAAGGGTKIDVSAFQDHTSGWGVTETATLVDTPGHIMNMTELGANQTAVYKTDAIYLASATTGLTPIRFDLHSTGIPGPSSEKSVIALSSGLHAILTRDGELFLFDGVNYTRHPSSDRIRTLYEQTATEDAGAKLLVHGFYSQRYNELWFFYIPIGAVTIYQRAAIMINMANGSVWRVNFNQSSFSFTASTFGSLTLAGSPNNSSTPLLGGLNGQIYTFNGSADGTTPIDIKMETGLSDLGESTRAKTVVETEHFFTNPSTTQSATVKIVTSEAGASPLASPSRSIVLTPTSAGPYTIGHAASTGARITSRFIGLSLQILQSTAAIQYLGSAITIIPRGSR